MNAEISRLRHLVSPPTSPLYNQGDWKEVEHELGTPLPDDYKCLIETFGAGGFVGKAYCSGLLISSYLAGRAVEVATGYSGYFRTCDSLPYKLYPEKPGLLGFASYGDKDTLAWNTTAAPEDWALVYHDPESGFHEVRMGTLAFVLAVLEESSPLHKAGVISTTAPDLILHKSGEPGKIKSNP